MIVGLSGSIVHKEPSLVHIDVGGVVYEVFISLHTFSALGNDETKLFTRHIVREDAQLLFGFQHGHHPYWYHSMTEPPALSFSVR